MSGLIKIDKEFQKLIPPLTTEEYRQLEENILAEGCRDALVLWNGTIVDGHNRYAICTENDIPFVTEEHNFESREEAKEWIIRNQLGRRNLPSYKMVELALKLKPMIQARAKENLKLATGGDRRSEQFKNQGSQKSDKVEKPIRTDEEIAKIARVSRDTVQKVERIINEGTEEQKERAEMGGKGNSISAIYDEIKNKGVETKVCIDCGEMKPVNEFMVGKNLCKECRKLRKSTREEKTLEPREEKPKEVKKDPYDLDLYDTSTVGTYCIDNVESEIDGSLENMLWVVDGCLEMGKDFIYIKENADRFNTAINNIINKLKERLINGAQN